MDKLSEVASSNHSKILTEKVQGLSSTSALELQLSASAFVQPSFFSPDK